MIAIAEEPQVLDIDAEELLEVFAEVMREWGFADSPTPKCAPVGRGRIRKHDSASR